MHIFISCNSKEIEKGMVSKENPLLDISIPKVGTLTNKTICFFLKATQLVKYQIFYLFKNKSSGKKMFYILLAWFNFLTSCIEIFLSSSWIRFQISWQISFCTEISCQGHFSAKISWECCSQRSPYFAALRGILSRGIMSLNLSFCITEQQK